MKKRLFLTTAFVAIFGCFVSMADVSPRGNGPEKPRTEKVDKKGGKNNDLKNDKVSKNHKPNKPVANKPAPKPNHKPVAHKPSHKPNKHVAHKPHHKPAPRPVCHVKHHHKPTCHRPHTKVVFNPLDPFAVGVITTAAIVAAIVD